VQRKICSYFRDERNDWVAVLDCAHGQHIRHNPPFANRPWVDTAEGRTGKLGFELDCVRCDRFELPENLTYYKSTPDFNEATMPAGLRKDHTTKTGTWGLIKVNEGQLSYVVGVEKKLLSPSEVGVVVPNMAHSVQPVGPVVFCVEFYRVEEGGLSTLSD
jgi:tellurite methyltransferase